MADNPYDRAKKMKISIVMATYNGEYYIEEQIKSIYLQTRPADEVLIFDDRSTDRTAEIVKRFIHDYKLEATWHFEVNQRNKGCILNFLDGAEQASGDVIFYSDQDDIWGVKKIELMEKGFAAHPDMKACYCLRHYIDTEGNEIPIKYAFMSNVKVKTDGFQKVSFREVIKYNKSPGLCLGIKKELIQETRAMILDHGLTHDLPIGSVAAVYDGYYVLNQKLVYYRQHGKNVSAPRIDIKGRLSGIDKQIAGRIGRYEQMVVIYNKYKLKLSEQDKMELRKAIKDTEDSIDYLKDRNLRKLFIAMFKKSPMMNRWIAVNNFLICLKEKIK